MINKKIEILILYHVPFTSNLFDLSSPNIVQQNKRMNKKQNQRIREIKTFIAKEINSISFVFFHVMYGICFVLIDLIDDALVLFAGW